MVKSMMRFFSYDHLPENLQKVSKPIADLAHSMTLDLPECTEKEVGLRKLLEAKDCFVRASLETKSGHFVIHLGEGLFVGSENGRIVAGKIGGPSIVSFARRELAVEFAKDNNITCDFKIVQESEIDEQNKKG